MSHTENKPSRFYTTALIAAATLCLLPGCGEDDQSTATEQAIESAAKAQGQEVKVNIENNKTTIETQDDEGKKVTYEASDNAATITTEEGNMTMQSGDAAKVPDNYPVDGVLYPDMKLDMAVVQDTAFMLAGTTTDTPEKIQTTLNAQAKEKGWQSQGSFQQPGVTMLSFTKGERALNVTINTAAGTTQVSITVSE